MCMLLLCYANKFSFPLAAFVASIINVNIFAISISFLWRIQSDERVRWVSDAVWVGTTTVEIESWEHTDYDGMTPKNLLRHSIGYPFRWS